ncbi:MAG TPA: fused MFS/spermidine synthase [Mariprofundaceae bacterium]|nr:fused MFS/spermidine synthase [Mariprofundaceae bacterium]
MTVGLPLLLYTVSGITALAYEVLWMRLVSTLSGASSFGMVATLIAFMAGLGLGSGVGARLRLSPRQGLQLFGAIEISVALFSLLLPYIASSLEQGFEAMAASMGIEGWMSFHVITCVLLLLIPATALGMTFPAVLRALSTSDMGVGPIYGLNTLGGVLGSLTPLLLLPWLGWAPALRAVASLGMVIGLTALILAALQERSSTSVRRHAPAIRPAWLELAAYAGIGAAALMLEVGWTRLYSLVFMRTEYVLGVILAAVLLGIALGSLLARRFNAGLLNILPLVGSLAALMPLVLLPSVSAWMDSADFSSLASSLVTQGAIMFVLTLLATLALGAWLPLITRRQREKGAAAWLYAFNSTGAALGAGVAGWLVLPWLGSAGVVCVAAMLLGLCGIYWCEVPRARALPLLAIPVVVFVWQTPPVSQLLPGEYAHTRELFHDEDSVSTTDVVARPNGTRILLNDLQRVDASTDPTAVAVQRNQGRLPLLLHPGARSILFLGLGTGITASPAKQIPGVSAVAVELSPGAIKAAGRWFSRFNGDAPTWLDIRHDDARRFLMADDARHFDVIVGDLFHPDLAGRGLLLSRQQFARVRGCLNPSGIYVQWLALNQFDVPSLKIILATFRTVFPHNTMMMDGFHLAMVGFRQRMPKADAIAAWAERHGSTLTGGEGWQTWLGRDMGPIPAFDSPLQDEWLPTVEFRLARARVEGRLDVAHILKWLLDQRPKPKVLLQRWRVGEKETTRVVSAALATDAMMHAWEGMFSDRKTNVMPFMQLAYRANPDDRWVGFAVADAMADRLRQLSLPPVQAERGWKRILSIRPDHVGALRALWHLARQRGQKVRAVELFTRLEHLVPLDPEVLAAQHERR